MFPSFFLGGFECTVAHHARGGSLDQVRGTAHDQQADEDYALLRSVGIRAAREGIRWPLVDDRGRLSFGSVQPMVQAARAHGVQVIWDLFHFGYPADADPLQASFPERFAAYARAAASFVAKETQGPHWFTPVNEPSYLAWAGGEAALYRPGLRGRAPDLKRALVAAALAGREAILEVSPSARFLQVDPVVRVVPPEDRPDRAEEVEAFNEGAVFEAWDRLSEAGALDVVGVNYYWTNQWEWGRHGHLALDDPRRVPLSFLLRSVWQRYRRPILVSETSHLGAQRAPWMREAVREVALCLREGIPVVGLCWYPVLSMPEWEDPTTWTCLGLWDLERDGERLRRVPCEEALEALREGQELLVPALL